MLCHDYTSHRDVQTIHYGVQGGHKYTENSLNSYERQYGFLPVLLRKPGERDGWKPRAQGGAASKGPAMSEVTFPVQKAATLATEKAKPALLPTNLSEAEAAGKKDGTSRDTIAAGKASHGAST